MPNAITAEGITTATQAELVAQFTAAAEIIYGADIDLDAETPDGEWMMTFIQATLDLEDLIVQVYNSFDPDNAIGNVLDQRVAINGIQRQAGTVTVTNVTIATSQSVNLLGLDQTDSPPFTVADQAGNQYELQVTQLGFNPGSGGAVLAFQAAVPGAITPTPNTITVPVTIVLGVTSINNPTGPTSIGLNEESDAALRVRRQQSVSLASQGYLAGLLAALKNISGMTAAFVYENNTNDTDIDGVPGHSIWVIVSGTAAAADIANAIYTKRNAGCGMFGTVNFVITQVDGTLFTVTWDTVVQEILFTKFNVSSINGTSIPNIAAIRAGLSISLAPGVFQEVNVNELATLVQEIDANTLVTDAGFDVSAMGTFDNNVFAPSAKNKQFEVLSKNIIILPMILAAAGGQQIINDMDEVVSTAQVIHGGNHIQFSTLGGYGTDGAGTGSPPPNNLVYSIQSSSGGGASIDATTGLYTSSAVGTDVILVTDLLSNTAICTVTVT